MEGKQAISLYRNRLDKTLSSHDLVNEEILKTLVKNQIRLSSSCETDECTDNVVEKRTMELSNLLGMLRSASESAVEFSNVNGARRGGWKIKQDTHEYRVMYREGPEGTPFHTLLAEGYVDGPMDHCLCISWESSLYKKWWPQFSIPTFKVVYSECLQKVRVGEHISLVRMKVSWPLSAREALIHFFAFEYFQDDLVVVLLNSISDLESIDRSTHGFSRDGIPDEQHMVRIDVVGGFALQKVTEARSYFRTIANMDLKLDFVPPAFINFVSRQLIGSGFKLYQKQAALMSKGDDVDFAKALKEPLYTRTREALFSDIVSKDEPMSLGSEVSVPPEEPQMTSLQAETVDMDSVNTGLEVAVVFKPKVGEIEEIEEEDFERSRVLEPTPNGIVKKSDIYIKTNVAISSQVEEALGTLEKIISVIRENGFSPHTRSPHGIIDSGSKNSEKDARKDPYMLEHQIFSEKVPFVEALSNESMLGTSLEDRSSSGIYSSRLTRHNSYPKDGKDSRIAPASSEEVTSPSEADGSLFSFSKNIPAKVAVVEKGASEEIVNSDANGKVQIDSAEWNKKKKKRRRFCCLHLGSTWLIS